MGLEHFWRNTKSLVGFYSSFPEVTVTVYLFVYSLWMKTSGFGYGLKRPPVIINPLPKR